MKGTYFLGNKLFETKEIPDPIPSKGEVRIKVKACGVCGTDVHIYEGSKGSAQVTPPIILGHEFSGIVDAVGEGVDNVAIGDHVTVDPNMYCGKCHYCHIGKKHLCENLRAYGVNENGGFAEMCIVKQEQCYKLNNDIPFQFGAMTEPLACAIHGINLADIRVGDSVCIIGGGAIGLLMVQLARHAGASTVFLSEPVEFRRKIALEVGADETLDPIHENILEKIKNHIGTNGVDHVIECVGNSIALRQGLEICDKGGVLVIFAVHPTDETDLISPFAIYQKELTIKGSFINPDTHERAVSMINNHQIMLEPLITHSFPVDQLENAILMQKSDKSIKVIIEPNNKQQ